MNSNETSKHILLDEYADSNGLEFQMISGVPMITVPVKKKDKAVKDIVNLCGESGIFRIINGDFVDEVIEFGTDKEHIDHDFRHCVKGLQMAYDAHGVEKNALKHNLKKADVFCASDYFSFKRDLSVNSRYCSSTLGIPEDLSAIVIYKSDRLSKIDDTDGYFFKDVKNKREALLCVIQFERLTTDFEEQLIALNIDEQIQFLERRVYDCLTQDFDDVIYRRLALIVIRLLYRESLKNVLDPSDVVKNRMSQLKGIADALSYWHYCRLFVVPVLNEIEKVFSNKKISINENNRTITNFISCFVL
ncbi:MAG: hypothetical protein UR28_C0039G0030 [Candidatus Peregrinibacteria bacterium GW2011_GWF2_33_10]|nr:MAG: hypothetical protein UR28_C0039G0030 [Candidatus Peregrinibacteria bacterium GW2011_GWF2_33_10]